MKIGGKNLQLAFCVRKEVVMMWQESKTPISQNGKREVVVMCARFPSRVLCKGVMVVRWQTVSHQHHPCDQSHSSRLLETEA